MSQARSRAGVIVGGAGDGVVSAVLAAGKPFVCIPEARPYEEQVGKATRLASSGAAVVRTCWPAPGEWAGVLAEASRLDPRRAACLHDPDGPRRAAAFLLAQAERWT